MEVQKSRAAQPSWAQPSRFVSLRPGYCSIDITDDDDEHHDRKRLRASAFQAAEEWNEPPLSAHQEILLRKVLIGRENVFISGAAGTGKSRTLRELIRQSPEEGTFVTAMTGIAATQLPRGTTVHSFAGIGLAKGTKDQCLAYVRRNPSSVKRWKQAQILLIDEVSMMSQTLFETLDYVAKKIRRNNKPFGTLSFY